MNVRRAFADSPGGARHLASTTSARRRRGPVWWRRRKGVAAVTSTALVAGVLVAAGVALSSPAQAASTVPMPTQATWSYSNPYTGTGSISPALTFDTNKIYLARGATPFVTTLSPNASGVVTSAADTSMVTSVTDNGGFAATQMETVAFDSGGEDASRTPTMYFWSYGQDNTVTSAAIGGAAYPTPRTSYQPLFAFTEGVTAPSRVYFVPSGSNSWAGGEVDQNSGYLYFTSTAGSTIQTNFQMLVFDPATGKYNQSGRIAPATAADTISGAPASDMALDAAGNAYLVINGASARNPSTGNSQTTAWLVRVTPGEPGQWKYSRVTPLFRDSNGDGVGEQNVTSSNDYGMAFLNGQLYAAYAAGRTVDRIDPLTGTVTQLSGSTGALMYDFTSGQPAAVLEGTVYDDVNADGHAGAGEVGVPDQTVVLYDDTGKVIGTQQTNQSGSYYFLLASREATYHVRLAQPVVNGANAVQTFGKGSTLYGLNGVEQMSRGGAGTGAPATSYVDPVPAKWGTTTDLSTIAAYARIKINSGSDLVTQDFGVTTLGSYGDAPASYRSTTAQKGPQGIEAPAGSGVWLGETRGSFTDGSNADGHGWDDGVMLTVHGQRVPLADQILVSGKTYPLTAVLGGDGAATATVNAWLAPVNSGDTGTFPATPSATAATAGTAATLNVTPTGSPTGGLSWTWLRVYASTNPNITAPDNRTGQYAPAPGSAASNTQTWTSDGEVEDYKVYQASAVVRIAVENDLPGTFEFSDLTNVSTTAPSSKTDSIQVTETNKLTYSGRAHAVVDAAQDVVVTVSAVPEGDVLQSATIVNSITGDVISVVEAIGNTFTVPAAALVSDGDVTLELVYAATPILTINQAQGMVDPTMARDLHFTLTSSVPLDPASVTESSFRLTATAVPETIEGSILNPRVVSATEVPGSDGKVFDVVVRVDDSATVAVEVPAGRVLTPVTALKNTTATWTDNEITYLNPLQVSPPRFTLVTGEPNGKDYSILIKAGAPIPTADLNFTATVSQPSGGPPLTLGSATPKILAGTSQSEANNVTAADGPVAANTETVIAHTVTSADTNYDGLRVPPVNPYLFATDPTIRIEKRAWVAKDGFTFDQSSAESIESTGVPAPKGTRLSDRQTVCFVYTVSNTSQDDWATTIKNITVTDSDTRLGQNGVIGTIAEIEQGGPPVKVFGCTALKAIDTTTQDASAG